jgi:hypothetical protein
LPFQSIPQSLFLKKTNCKNWPFSLISGVLSPAV